MQGAEELLKIFNFLQSESEPQGYDILYRKKVESLTYPLFSFRHPDLVQKNTLILSEIKQCSGGSAQTPSIRELYLDERNVFMGGSLLFLLVDNKGMETVFFVDMQPIHFAFIGLRNSVQSHDGQENLHLSIVRKLIEELSHSSKSSSPHKVYTSPGKR